MSARLRLARRIHGVAATAARAQQSVVLANVVRVTPLRIELIDAELPPLDYGEDFDLTVAMRAYRSSPGFQVGDTVLAYAGDGYIVFAVVA